MDHLECTCPARLACPGLARLSVSASINAEACDSDDTITMVMVVLLFLACNVLALVINIVEAFFEVDTLILNFMSDASNFLVILNSSVNFVIYMVFCKDFFQCFW